MSEIISARDIQVGDEIEFTTADGKTHCFIVGELPRADIHILPEDAARKRGNLLTLAPLDQVTRYRNVNAERLAGARAVGRLTAQRMATEPARATHQHENRGPRCDEYNLDRQGVCDAPLDRHGQCPNASSHGDSRTGREAWRS